MQEVDKNVFWPNILSAPVAQSVERNVLTTTKICTGSILTVVGETLLKFQLFFFLIEDKIAKFN